MKASHALKVTLTPSLLIALASPALHAAPLSEPLRFSAACAPRTSELTLTAVGDLLLHSPLQRQAAALGSQGGFATLWNHVQPWLDAADLRYANLEGPISKSAPTSSYPQFNYAPALSEDLRTSGFSILSTANNHTLDQGARGANETIAALDAAGLPHVGTREKSNTTLDRWSVTTETRGFRLTWIACTFSTNGIPDKYHQVLDCYRDETTLMQLIREASADPMNDAVIVTPHWGVEYKFKPEAREKALARRMLEAGALAVIGAHPHVLQPMEKHLVAGKERFVIHSLGNFVSGQTGTSKRTSTLLHLQLVKTREGTTEIAGVRALPLLMTTRDGRIGVSPAIDIKNQYGAAALQMHRNVLHPENELATSRTFREQLQDECR
jgi:poly-gamma-glutamate capsule biosynthesis protein CapA/YwtB (metallophosphatase superfamily)